jgi:hypothetical protein
MHVTALTSNFIKSVCVVQVGSGQGRIGVPFSFSVSGHKENKLHLWSFDNPYLYDLQVSLQDATSTVAGSNTAVLSSSSPLLQKFGCRPFAGLDRR